MYYTQSNFLINHEHRDFFSDVQRNKDRIGNKGKESDEFKDRAYKQFHEHNFNNLAKIQDSFEPEDETAGTPHRPHTRNYNRMEYDIEERNEGDGKEHAKVMETLDATEMKISDVLDGFSKLGYTIVSTAAKHGTDPIKMEDYDDQIKL